MSGLLERIVRTRRAAASSRPGPQDQSGLPPAPATPRVNGSAPANGGAPTLAPPSTTPETPAPQPAGRTPDPQHPSFLERARIRRRVRRLRAQRELELRDLGGFIAELSRFGHGRPELVQEKTDRALATEAELRRLEHALGAEEPLRELRVPGIAGRCARCGALHGSGDRFCSSCGEPTAGR